ERPPLLVTSATVAIVAAAAGLALLLRRERADAVVQAVETRTPASRNVLRTGWELTTGRIVAPPYVEARVIADAARLASRIDLRVAMPPGRAALALAAGGAAFALSLATPPRWLEGPTEAARSSPAVRGVLVGVVLPAYSGGARTELRDPDRIEALAGSTLELSVTADATAVSMVTLNGTRDLSESGARTFTTSLVAEGDGFLAIEPRLADGSVGPRRLIGVAVTPDRPPTVRVVTPGRDLIVPSGPRSLSVAIEAGDDLGLASLVLRYTKISGSGENFSFKNGDVPVTISRKSDRAWSARVDWSLASLALEPGDMLVYRGAATDARPGAPVTESDAFILEIAAPGALPSEGFAIDDRQDKYAISQQMVIVKTERLLAARKSMSPNDFQEGVLDLAAEQRQVRAEFVFMMGGELADAGLDLSSLNEEVEAAGEEDLAAGRLANQGRLDLLRAIRAMSQAASRLADVDASGALPLEKDALSFLQRAFSRSRYLLRTLSQREQIDLSRRLSGLLAALARDERAAGQAAPNPRAQAARAALTELAAMAAQPDQARRDSARIAALAQDLIAIDPSSPALRDVAGAVTAFEFERATLMVAAFVRDLSPSAAAAPMDADLSALAGALADALRHPQPPRGGR
ncbi:MAG TPA: hypothetical protein VFO31_02640, partial [Vicinamibacterales bacterium]|nr:hypothetical protein [Vicinamibacterales bacterium]